MTTFQEEKIENIIDEIKPILVKHWKELANHQEDRPLDVDWGTYILLNNLGRVRVFTARADTKLIGYVVMIISPHLHYKTWIYSSCDVYYVDPEYRNNGVGATFFVKVAEWLKSLGVKSAIMHEKVSHPHGKLFEALGYNLVERYYEKVL